MPATQLDKDARTHMFPITRFVKILLLTGLAATELIAGEYSAQEHNLRAQAQKIESATYHLSEQGFRITEIEDCVLYDHQAVFELGARSYSVHVKQVIINLRTVTDIDFAGPHDARFTLSEKNQALTSASTLVGKDVANVVSNFRIEALNPFLWESFLTNASGNLVGLYREAAWDSSVSLLKMTSERTDFLFWDFAKFYDLRPDVPNELLMGYFDLCGD